jgi:hypothetical protein
MSRQSSRDGNTSSIEMTIPDVPVPGHDPSTEADPRAVRIIVAGVLVTIFGGIAIFIVVKVLNPPPPAFSAGDCVALVQGGLYAGKVEKVGCAQDAALYEVGVYLNDQDTPCPAGSYSSFAPTRGTQQEYRLCLVLNVEAGDCLRVPALAHGVEARVACTGGRANATVTAVLHGTADKAGCGPGSAEAARVYPVPRRTVCLAPVTG